MRVTFWSEFPWVVQHTCLQTSTEVGLQTKVALLLGSFGFHQEYLVQFQLPFKSRWNLSH